MMLNQPVAPFCLPPGLAGAVTLTGSLPRWDQFPAECQRELIQTLALLVLHCPEVQALQEKCDERQ
jgi:hypothetical protein